MTIQLKTKEQIYLNLKQEGDKVLGELNAIQNGHIDFNSAPYHL